MKSLEYLEEIKEQHLLSNEDLIDILTNIGYIARDNNLSDAICDELIEILVKED